MLNQTLAVEKINEAVLAGAPIYCPSVGQIKEIPQYRVGRVTEDLTVFFDENGHEPGIGWFEAIGNDYRLESMYAQAQAFLLNPKK